MKTYKIIPNVAYSACSSNYESEKKKDVFFCGGGGGSKVTGVNKIYRKSALSTKRVEVYTSKKQLPHPIFHSVSPDNIFTKLVTQIQANKLRL